MSIKQFTVGERVQWTQIGRASARRREGTIEALDGEVATVRTSRGAKPARVPFALLSRLDEPTAIDQLAAAAREHLVDDEPRGARRPGDQAGPPARVRILAPGAYYGTIADVDLVYYDCDHTGSSPDLYYLTAPNGAKLRAIGDAVEPYVDQAGELQQVDPAEPPARARVITGKLAGAIGEIVLMEHADRGDWYTLQFADGSQGIYSADLVEPLDDQVQP